MIWRLLKSGFGKGGRGHADPLQQDEFASHNKPHLVEKGYYFGRPVRIYSDGSMKAATREGWIRFSDFPELVRFFDKRRLPYNDPDDGDEAATQ